ncbi:MAG: hypothetical protein U0103_10335 [Candidatus Obscuribacterales bacterium]
MTNSTLTTTEQPTSAAAEQPVSTSSHSAFTFNFFEHCKSAIIPKVFLTSALIGFLTCCALGFTSTQVNWFKRFQRFYPGISPSYNFFPTISEMKAIVYSRLRKDQVLVIVGGNSVFNGVGQPKDKIWTERLQNILGDKYCVVNFAFRGAFPFEGGYFAAESFAKEHPRTVYVTNSGPTAIGIPSGGDTYGYLYWQSRFRGEQIQDAEREATIDAYIAGLKESEAEKVREVKLRNQLDSIFYFTDLWNAVALKGFTTIWQDSPDPYGPKRRTQDIEPDPAPLAGRFKMVDIELKNIRSFSQPLFNKRADGTWVQKALEWNEVSENLSRIIPQSMRKNTVVVLVPNCPFYVKKLPSDEQVRDAKLLKDGQSKWRAAGFDCLVPNNLIEDDFFDRCHIAPSGGQKLAELVAPEVISIASKLDEKK